MADVITSNITNDYLEFDYQSLVDAVDKYYKTLSKLGYIAGKEEDYILVYTFIIDFYKQYYDSLSNDDRKALFDTLKCINDKSCVFNN